SGLDDAALREVALDVLSSQLSLERARLDADLTGFWRSHWDTDPYAHGAYSYVLTGGLEASRRLCETVDGALLFAGEACAGGSARGTVHGAIASGIAAARQVLAQLAD